MAATPTAPANAPTTVLQGSNGQLNYAAQGNTTAAYQNSKPTSINPPAPVNPVIPATTVAGQQPSTSPLNLPSTAPNSAANPMAQNVATASALNANQQALLAASNANEQNAQANYDSSGNTLNDLMNSYLGEGQDAQNMENAAGIPALQTTAGNASTDYNAQNLAYNQQLSDIANRPGITASQAQNEMAGLQQQQSATLSAAAIRSSIAQNNYNTALAVVQNQIQIKYAPIKDAITFQEQVLANNKDILTEQQTNQFQANIAVQNQQYTQGTYYSQLNATTGLDMVKSAAANGADPATLQAMSTAVSNGGSIADVASAAGNYLQTGNYTMQYNPATSQMEPLNTNTGLFKDGTSGTGSTVDTSNSSSANTVTDPTGMTMNFNTSGYNTADQNYALKMQETIGKITSSVGTITDASTAQAAITQFAPTSNLTGQDVITAAQSAGIPPTTFLAQLINESGCGTSNVATKNNNYGGIAWANQSGATQGSARPASEGGYYAKFATPQDGLEAQAQLDKKSIAAPTAATTGQTETTQYSLQNYTALKSSLPSNLAPAMGYMTQTGDAYIDISKVTDLPGAPTGTAATKIEQFASQHGITVLTGTQAAAMQDADTALTQINNLQTAWNQVMSYGNSGLNPSVSVQNAAASAVHNQRGNAITAYLNMDTSGLDVLNSITGSKRLSTFSASVAANALPVMQGLLPGDSLESGNQKLDDLRKEISASITPIIATSKGAPLSGEINAAQQGIQTLPNGQKWQTNADGSMTRIQ